jgi:hypothetical protein
MITYKSTAPTRQLDGWHIWFYFDVDGRRYTREQRFIQDKIPDQKQIDEAIIKQQVFVEQEDYLFLHPPIPPKTEPEIIFDGYSALYGAVKSGVVRDINTEMEKSRLLLGKAAQQVEP